MTKEEIEDLEEIKSYFKYTCDNNIEYFIKVINQLQQENEKQKEILDILKPHLKMVQDVNGLVGLEYDMSALIMKEKKLIKEWLESDRI